MPAPEPSADDDLLALKEDFAVPAQPSTMPSPASAAPSPASSVPYLGPPVSELKHGAAEPSWMQNDGIIPIKEDDPPPPTRDSGAAQGGDDLFLGDPPAAPTGATDGGVADPSAAPQGNVYEGDVYQGEEPQGDVYQGDVYQGESAQTGAMATATVEAVGGVPLRGLIVAIFAGTVAATAWYWLSVTTGWQFTMVSWLIGVGVGLAAVAGTGRNGMDAAVIAAAITGLALLMGEFQIAKYVDQRYEVISAELAVQAEAIEKDGDYTDEEVAILMGMRYQDFQALSNSEQQVVRMLAQLAGVEYDEDYYGEEYGDASSFEDEYGGDDASLTLGSFIGNFRHHLGFKGIIIWLAGVGAAFRLGLGSTD